MDSGPGEHRTRLQIQAPNISHVHIIPKQLKHNVSLKTTNVPSSIKGHQLIRLERLTANNLASEESPSRHSQPDPTPSTVFPALHGRDPPCRGRAHSWSTGCSNTHLSAEQGHGPIWAVGEWAWGLIGPCPWVVAPSTCAVGVLHELKTFWKSRASPRSQGHCVDPSHGPGKSLWDQRGPCPSTCPLTPWPRSHFQDPTV